MEPVTAMKVGAAQIIKANALDLPVADESVDLIVTSPPYFALRSYQDEGEHYGGQIGSEDTPAAFLEALWAAMAECWRVLKPSGSCWINLGDKYAGSGGHNNAGVSSRHQVEMGADEQAAGEWKATRRQAPDSYTRASDGIRAKSLLGMPWRFAIGCIDGKGAPDGRQWILRAEVIWDKPNGLPESVTDRVRRSHEQWFHFTKSQRYFAAVDEVREAQEFTGGERKAGDTHRSDGGLTNRGMGAHRELFNPLGKLPGSVWSIPSQPLSVPDHLGVDHFAAFPTEWPRRIILGWSPSGICTDCGEGRRPVVDKTNETLSVKTSNRPSCIDGAEPEGNDRGWNGAGYPSTRQSATITGYACACPEPTAPTTPATVLDPFGGTGTVALVAKALGRNAISVDLSGDYCKLAQWRCNDPQNLRNVQARTYGIKRDAPAVTAGQVSLFEDGAA